MNRASIALKMFLTKSPKGNAKISAPDITLSPAKLTITNETAANRNVPTSLFPIFNKPTNNPIKTNKPDIVALVVELRLIPMLGIIPITTAKITPTKKAHAPTKFSLAFTIYASFLSFYLIYRRIFIL